MNIKRFLALVLVLCMMALALTACGGTSDNTSGSAASTAAGASTPATADNSDSGKKEVYKFTFTVHSPPTETNCEYILNWAKEVKAATDGQVEINVFHSGSLANQSESYKSLESGAVDGAWVYTGSFPGQFPLSDVVSVPFLGVKTTTMGTDLMWDVSEAFPEIAAEIKGYYPVIHVSTAVGFLLSGGKEVTKMADLKGMNIRVANDVASAVLKLWGANPIYTSFPEIYDSMSKKVIDGCIAEYPGAISFGIDEVTKYTLEIPFQVGNWFLLWNEDTMNKMPAELVEKVKSMSGRELSLKLAGILDTKTETGRQKMIAAGTGVNVPTPENYAEFDKVAQEYSSTWVETLSGNPTVGAKALEWCREYLKNYK